MKPPSLALLAGSALGLTVLVLASLGAPIDRPAPPPPPRPTAEPASIAAGGVTLASASVALPDDDGQYPAGAHADTVNVNCTACHSPSMALRQPPLSADQWKAEVTKMREAYHAPVAEQDVPAIVAYLTAMPGQAAAGAGKP